MAFCADTNEWTKLLPVQLRLVELLGLYRLWEHGWFIRNVLSHFLTILRFATMPAMVDVLLMADGLSEVKNHEHAQLNMDFLPVLRIVRKHSGA